MCEYCSGPLPVAWLVVIGVIIGSLMVGIEVLKISSATNNNYCDSKFGKDNWIMQEYYSKFTECGLGLCYKCVQNSTYTPLMWGGK